ncbi:MAG: alpha/beta hydrolase [Actinoplanes sp.]
MSASNPEIGRAVDVRGIATNYHDHGDGPPVLLLHGSGPGVSAWANWRTVLPVLSRHLRVVAPDILGFGYTERPPDTTYRTEAWLEHLLGFLDAVGLSKFSVVGNSFGGALALRLAVAVPERVDRMVLMGSVGVHFPITPGLEAVWGFEPSLDAMRRLLDVFTHDAAHVGDDLAHLRLAAATRPGVQETYAKMFPAPRQRMVDALALDEAEIRALPHRALIVHGRDDQVIPLSNSLRLLQLIRNSQLHVFGRCGHWVQIEHGPEFAALVTNFLTQPPVHAEQPTRRGAAPVTLG